MGNKIFLCIYLLGMKPLLKDNGEPFTEVLEYDGYLFPNMLGCQQDIDVAEYLASIDELGFEGDEMCIVSYPRSGMAKTTFIFKYTEKVIKFIAKICKMEYLWITMHLRVHVYLCKIVCFVMSQNNPNCQQKSITQFKDLTFYLQLFKVRYINENILTYNNQSS